MAPKWHRRPRRRPQMGAQPTELYGSARAGVRAGARYERAAALRRRRGVLVGRREAAPSVSTSRSAAERRAAYARLAWGSNYGIVGTPTRFASRTDHERAPLGVHVFCNGKLKSRTEINVAQHGPSTPKRVPVSSAAQNRHGSAPTGSQETRALTSQGPCSTTVSHCQERKLSSRPIYLLSSTPRQLRHAHPGRRQRHLLACSKCHRAAQTKRVDSPVWPLYAYASAENIRRGYAPASASAELSDEILLIVGICGGDHLAGVGRVELLECLPQLGR